MKHLPSVAEVDAADEGVELVDDHQLLVVRPQERVHVRPAVGVPEHLQQSTAFFTKLLELYDEVK